jgi:hypothetical protein
MPTSPSLYTSYRDSQLHFIHASAVFYGFADPGTRVQVWNGNTLLSTVTAKADGLWDTPEGLVLPEGSYHVTAISIDAAGNKSSPSAALDVQVDETPPAAPTIVLEQLGTAGGVPTVFSGIADPNGPVILDFGQVGDVIGAADASGHWSISVLLPDGHYTVKAVAHDRAGNTSPTVTLTFDRAVSDDVGGDAAHANLLPLDSKVAAKIDYFGDRDWFKVSLQELTTYTISLLGAKTGGGTLPIYSYSAHNLSLWDPKANGGAGAEIELNAMNTDKADFAAMLPVTHSGDYYLSVYADSQIGSYTLGVTTYSHDDYYGDQAHAAAVAANGTINGHFDYGGDVDMFKVRLEAGKTYTFELAPGSGIPYASLQVADGSGTTVVRGSFNEAGHETAVVVAPAAGDYYVSASYDYPASSQGTYQLIMKEASDDYGGSTQNSGKLALGGSVSGVIEVGNDHDWFAVNLQAGTAYRFLLELGDNAGYGSLALHDASGKQVSLFDTGYNHGRLLMWTPGTSGTYFVDVSDLAANVRYTLQANLAETDDYAASAAGAGLIKLGQDTAGRLETPTDVDWFKIPAQLNAIYTFSMTALGAPESGDLSVVDSAGRVLARSTYESNGQTSLTWQAGDTGNYYLAVSAYDRMYSYTVSSAVNDQDKYPGNPTTTGTLAPGGVVRSSLDFRDDTDWFKVELQAGHEYTFQVTGLKGDGGTLVAPGLQMFDGNKTLVWQWGGSPLDEPLKTFTAKSSGTFYVEVAVSKFSSFIGTGTGTYTLKEATPDVPLIDTVPPKALAIQGATFPGSDPRTSNFEVVFSEPVALGSGTLTLRLATGEVVEQFDVATSARLKVQGELLTVDPSAPLAWGSAYRIELDASAIKDKAGMPLAASVRIDYETIQQPLNVTGGPGDDVYASTSNSDTIDGGAGLDTVVYKAVSFAYNIINNTQNLVVWGKDRDTLLNVERVVFNDVALAFDLDGAAGQAYRLYQASFNRTPDTAGLGFWIAQMDKGMTLHEAAKNFIGSDEFRKLFGAAPSDADFVKTLYGNVLHRTPDQAGSDYWTGALQHGTERADVLVEFSTSAENQAAVIGQISQGIHYIPFH